MKKLLMLFLLVALYSLSFAQSNVSGTVKNIYGNTLAGAAVFLSEQNKGTICNENGEYTIGNLPAGNIKIQFSFIGYITILKTLVLQKGTNECNVSLVESVIETQEVVVTGGSVSSQHENVVKIDSNEC